MRTCAWAMAGLLAGVGLACDDKSDLPPEVIKAQQAPPVPATKPAPTTQQLLSGPKKSLALGDFPLTLQVPQDWALSSMASGQLIMVTGPASSGEISIQLSSQGQTVTAARLDAIVAETKREADAKPHPINRVELRTLGPARVLETRMISSKDFTGGKLAPEVMGDTVIENERTGEKRVVKGILNPHIVKWGFTAFIPAGEGKYTTRSLTFMGLKVSEYEQDKQFLEEMMKSLAYAE